MRTEGFDFEVFTKGVSQALTNSDHSELINSVPTLSSILSSDTIDEVEQGQGLALLFSIACVLGNWNDYVRCFRQSREKIAFQGLERFAQTELRIFFAFSLLRVGQCAEADLEFRDLLKQPLRIDNYARITIMLDQAIASESCSDVAVALKSRMPVL